MNRILHIGFNFAGKPKVLDLEPVIKRLGDDWIRYSTNNWLLWSSLPVVNVYQGISAHLDPQDHVLISAIDPGETVGFLPPWMWTWMQSKDPQSGVTFGDELRRSLLAQLKP
jgi:hypothetical protein